MLQVHDGLSASMENLVGLGLWSQWSVPVLDHTTVLLFAVIAAWLSNNLAIIIPKRANVFGLRKRQKDYFREILGQSANSSYIPVVLCFIVIALFSSAPIFVLYETIGLYQGRQLHIAVSRLHVQHTRILRLLGLGSHRSSLACHWFWLAWAPAPSWQHNMRLLLPPSSFSPFHLLFLLLGLFYRLNCLHLGSTIEGLMVCMGFFFVLPYIIWYTLTISIRTVL